MDRSRQALHNRAVSAISPRRTLEDLLRDAQKRITRLSPVEAHAATRAGAILIDIRSDSARERDGIVPGSLHIPRTVLEWRADPDSPSRSPHIPGVDQQIVLLCDHGYSTILAAATLAELGYAHACDVIGGFAAWREAVLPIAAAPAHPGAGEPIGMGPAGS